MRWSMNWNDTVKAAALATAAERTTTAGRMPVDTPWSWNPHDVWLTRIQPPRDLAARSASPHRSWAGPLVLRTRAKHEEHGNQ
jgi:hypothetical protein